MGKKQLNYYNVPSQFWYRVHFIRPRFKSNIENVLLYMANECCRIPKCSCEEYSNRYLKAIRMFPGNIDMTLKTLQNWRTEIPALFGFYKENKELNVTETSPMAIFLHENQNLTQFLRLFLLSFQFPGGHLKPQDIKEIIRHGIKFKPARTIIQVLMAGNQILSAGLDVEKEMSISAEEATYCIFNDIRVTSGLTTPTEIAKLILNNRRNKIKYYNPNDPKIISTTGLVRSKGDTTRYAGDILDYMEIANLLEKHHGFYTLKSNELSALNIFATDETWFDGYDMYYNQYPIEISQLSNVEPDWFEYVNASMNPDLFNADIKSIVTSTEIDVVFDERIKEIVLSDERTTKDIGNLGEAIICSHEKMRLKINGYDNFIRLIQIVDSPTYHPGFDIDSFEADGTENHRYIEVKTTISKQPIHMYGFHMSTNEWRVADTIKEHYYVYRLMLSEKLKTLFVLQNPVALYKQDKIDAEPRNGMEISFSTELFTPTELLEWKQ